MKVTSDKLHNLLKPKFIGIGAMRCGTTTLFDCFSQHSLFVPPRGKETRFFDWEWDKGMDYYFEHFPYGEESQFTGEFTPGYFSHPLAPRRISFFIPKPRLILMLRNPIDRAYSHYCMLRTLRIETLKTFEGALDLEPRRTNFRHRPGHDFEFHNFGYLWNGQYANHLRNWFAEISRDQILIIRSEDFFENPGQVWQEVCTFIDVPPQPLECIYKCNSFVKEPMLPVVREQLAEYFKPYNEQLYELIGRNMRWQ